MGCFGQRRTAVGGRLYAVVLLRLSWVARTGVREGVDHKCQPELRRCCQNLVFLVSITTSGPLLIIGQRSFVSQLLCTTHCQP